MSNHQKALKAMMTEIATFSKEQIEIRRRNRNIFYIG